MLSVIGAGFPRTGTSSTKAALERLGFGPCHHMFDLMAVPGRADRWLPLAEGKDVDWDHVFEGYRSAVDWPASHWWRAQAEAYPEAKVVLTVREPHSWYRSMTMLIASGAQRELPDDVPPAAQAMFQNMARLGPVLDLMAREAFDTDKSFREGMPDEDSAVAAFERHTADVRAALPPERLLVFDVREGWEPLCRFLGVEVPEGEPFPHLNDARTMQGMLDSMVTDGTVPSPFTMPA